MRTESRGTVPTGETIWLDERELIASFHAVDGYTPHDFSFHDHFMSFIQFLQEQGYRFQ